MIWRYFATKYKEKKKKNQIKLSGQFRCNIWKTYCIIYYLFDISLLALDSYMDITQLIRWNNFFYLVMLLHIQTERTLELETNERQSISNNNRQSWVVDMPTPQFHFYTISHVSSHQSPSVY